MVITNFTTIYIHGSVEIFFTPENVSNNSIYSSITISKTTLN